TNVAEALDAGDIHEIFRIRETQLQQRDQALSARQDLGVILILRQQSKRFLQVRRRKVFETTRYHNQSLSKYFGSHGERIPRRGPLWRNKTHGQLKRPIDRGYQSLKSMPLLAITIKFASSLEWLSQPFQESAAATPP